MCEMCSGKFQKIQAKLHYAAASVAVVPTAGTQIEPNPYLFLNGGMVGRALTKIWFDGVCTNEIVIFAYLNLDIVSSKCMEVQ